MGSAEAEMTEERVRIAGTPKRSALHSMGELGTASAEGGPLFIPENVKKNWEKNLNYFGNDIRHLNFHQKVIFLSIKGKLVCELSARKCCQISLNLIKKNIYILYIYIFKLNIGHKE